MDVDMDITGVCTDAGKRRKSVRFPAVLVYLSLLLSLSALIFAAGAAPHNGDEFQLAQPDGKLVPVRVFGDEFYQDVESLDGFTLIRGADGWICYAELSADGSEYVSTGVRYTGGLRGAAGARKGLRISKSSVLNKHRKNREILGYDELIAYRPEPHRGRSLSKSADGQTSTADVRKVVGLTLLIEFPDQRSSITRAAMNDFCNRAGGVNGTNPAGSVCDYYRDVSNGLLEYTNLVTPLLLLDSNKTYYDRGTSYQYVPQLLSHALNKLKATGFDVSTLTTQTTGTGNSRREVVLALNVLYAGSPTQGWSNGLWPHSGTMSNSGSLAVTIDGKSFSRYQLSNLGTGSNPPGIGTFVHENGHMIMGWPDLYSYESPTHSNGVGSWCVMNSNHATNPQQPNAYLRDLAGWISVTPLTDATKGVFTMPSNGHQAFKYARNNQESYYIEARRRTSASADPRNTAIPGSGLLIWHAHTGGDNTNTKKGFPQLELIQADGRNDLERKANSGDATDPFRARHNASFNKTTTPAAVYHDGIKSNIDISEVSDSGASMSFKAGGGVGGPPAYYLQVVNGQGSGYYGAGEVVDISAPEENAAGRAFMRWTGANLEFADVYTAKASVTIPAAEAQAVPNYARLFVLPGAVEADTFGYAQGIAGASNSNGATGNRVARVVDTSKFAEYAVNVGADGLYALSYRLVTSTTSAGKFYLRDASSGVLLDSVAVPTSARTSIQTVTGAAVSLRKGRAVWRFEAAGGNYSIDWIAAAPPSTTPTASASPAKALSYDIKTLPSGDITFTLPNAGHLSLRVYDVRGRLVATLLDGMRNSGAHKVKTSNIAAMGQGLYIVRMKSGGYSKDVRVRCFR